jgi:hypothetical protein
MTAEGNWSPRSAGIPPLPLTLPHPPAHPSIHLCTMPQHRCSCGCNQIVSDDTDRIHRQALFPDLPLDLDELEDTSQSRKHQCSLSLASSTSKRQRREDTSTWLPPQFDYTGDPSIGPTAGELRYLYRLSSQQELTVVVDPPFQSAHIFLRPVPPPDGASDSESEFGGVDVDDDHQASRFATTNVQGLAKFGDDDFAFGTSVSSGLNGEGVDISSGLPASVTVDEDFDAEVHKAGTSILSLT